MGVGRGTLIMQKTAEEILKQTHGNISTGVIGTRLSLPYEALCYGSNLVTDHTYRYTLATRDPVPFAIFQYTMDGCASFHHGRKDHDIPPGCAFITRTPSPCVYQQHPDYDSYHFVFFPMGGEGALALIDKIIERHGNVLTLPRGSKLIDLLCKHINDLRVKGEEQFDAYEESIFAYKFLVTLWRELSPEKNLITEEIPESLVRVAKYIEKHLSNPLLDVSDMAKEAKLSKWYFTRLFQKFCSYYFNIKTNRRRNIWKSKSSQSYSY